MDVRGGVSWETRAPLRHRSALVLGTAPATASPVCELSEALHLRPRTEAVAINLLLQGRARPASFLQNHLHVLDSHSGLSKHAL